MPINKEPATPPMIGKIGPYTVFVTPPPTPKPSFEPSPVSASESPKRKDVSPPPVKSSPPMKSAPPVLPPPVQYEKSASAYDSKFGFFWDAVAKVQNGIICFFFLSILNSLHLEGIEKRICVISLDLNPDLFDNCLICSTSYYSIVNTIPNQNYVVH